MTHASSRATAPVAVESPANAPQVSIVTPSYNQGAYIAATIESVVSQRADVDVEYILFDAQSNDQTPEVLERYAGQIDHLHVAPDDGQADALGRGFEHASGQILSYLNSDDTLLPGALAWVVRYFETHPEIDVIYGHRVFTDADGEVTRFWMLPPHSNYLMRRWDYIPQEACFWRRSVMDRFGGIDSTFQFAMDYEFFARVMPEVRFARVNKFLATFREHADSKTTTLNLTLGQEEVKRVQAMHQIAISALDQQIARVLSLTINWTARLLRPVLLSNKRYLKLAP